ncbi:MAG: DsbE family thiol:disulfide interchange protein [Rubrivivax sp.]
MKILKFLLPLALFLVLVGFLAVGLKRDPREVPSPLIGKPAPAFAAPRLDDIAQQIRRDDLLGKVWVLNVWASWCAPCREEHPVVTALARRGTAPVYGLNYKDQLAAARGWLQQHGNPYAATLVDADGRIGLDFGVYGVPETFVIDKTGTVRFKHVGVLTPAVVAERIAPLIQSLNAR